MNASDLVKISQHADQCRRIEDDVMDQLYKEREEAERQDRIDSIPTVLENLEKQLANSAHCGRSHWVDMDEVAYNEFKNATLQESYEDPVLNAIIQHLKKMGLKCERKYVKKQFSRREADGYWLDRNHRYHSLVASW